MSAVAVWAGVIVRDLEVSTRWYADVLPVTGVESGAGWVAFDLEGGSCVELHAGDRRRPGLVFPSYGAGPGPPVMPGFGVEDVGAATEGHQVLRVFPDWVVVAAPDGLRVVLTDRDCDPTCGLAGFAFGSPAPAELEAFLGGLGYAAEVEARAQHDIALLVAAGEDRELVDPEGTLVRLTTARVRP